MSLQLMHDSSCLTCLTGTPTTTATITSSSSSSSSYSLPSSSSSSSSSSHHHHHHHHHRNAGSLIINFTSMLHPQIWGSMVLFSLYGHLARYQMCLCWQNGMRQVHHLAAWHRVTSCWEPRFPFPLEGR